MKSRYSTFDYTVTISRRSRYLVVSAPEFGYQVASGQLDLGQASPDSIGRAVVQVMGFISQRLRELEYARQPHPEPRKAHDLLATELISAREAARVLGISRASLRKLVYAGRLTALRTAGGHFRFTLPALSGFMCGNPGLSGSGLKHGQKENAA